MFHRSRFSKIKPPADLPTYSRVFFFCDVPVALRGWKEQPAEMSAKLVLSAAFGQGVFWVIGHDQLGLFMDPKAQFGVGRKVAECALVHLPQDETAAWVYKVVEISTDALRGVTEHWVYARHQMAPDVVAALLTPPLWTCGYEVSEKILGTILHPERVVTPDGIRLSVANTYGNLFRIAQDATMLATGGWLYDTFGHPLANLFRRVGRAVS